MAVDEALLESAATTGTATLRLYQWSEPTLSLGYFQAAAERDSHPTSRNCPVVRRASGGGAILHDRELTYSLALPEKSATAATSRRLYELCHATLIDVLGEFGLDAKVYGSSRVCENDQAEARQEPFLCFQRRSCFDIISSGEKIVGSAQRRRRGAVLQHGSVLLSRSKFAAELPGIEQLAVKPISVEWLSQIWPPQLAGSLGYSLVCGRLTAVEKASAEAHCHERFTADNWLHRR